jgi:hypothetical protein
MVNDAGEISLGRYLGSKFRQMRFGYLKISFLNYVIRVLISSPTLTS